MTLNEISRTDLPNGMGYMSVNFSGEQVVMKRFCHRSRVTNLIYNYEFISKDGTSALLPLTLQKANEIIERIRQGCAYASIWVFHEDVVTELDMSKTEMEHQYTSTGIKFWRHQEQMFSYRDGSGKSVISTHISPEGGCNLSCPYCSVTYRDTHSRIPLEVIQDYVEKLQSRGLRAVILTGGGEPTLYKDFNELVRWLSKRGLSIGLITNGTQSKRITDDVWQAFSWVRVSINLFNGWENRIDIPVCKLNPDCIVGCSMVFTSEHEMVTDDRLATLHKVQGVADKIGAKYVRLLPNCLLDQDKLVIQHKALDKLLSQMKDKRFFHQHKVHGAPQCNTCHQAYFRPYLSEEIYAGNGLAGTVYPCDSVVLNDSFQRFGEQYQICHASQILDFLDKKIEMKFTPRSNCSGCVFTDNVNMLDAWTNHKVDRFAEFSDPLTHEEFV